MADRIDSLATEPETRHRMAEHNRHHARERFAAVRVAARLEAIYREVLGRDPKQKPRRAKAQS
jgi:glycosyltransferase involved in cell wall biosynthesis